LIFEDLEIFFDECFEVIFEDEGEESPHNEKH
jgi:hypothetical protein